MSRSLDFLDTVNALGQAITTSTYIWYHLMCASGQVLLFMGCVCTSYVVQYQVPHGMHVYCMHQGFWL